RHTRFSRDWSSDVCSSDLILAMPLEKFEPERKPVKSSKKGFSTHAALLLDRSGSMAPHVSSALEGVNNQLAVLQAGAKKAGCTQDRKSVVRERIGLLGVSG